MKTMKTTLKVTNAIQLKRALKQLMSSTPGEATTNREASKKDNKESGGETRGISLLATLRGLVPQRALRYAEAERIAELQANRFRELLGNAEPKLETACIAGLPRIVVRRSFNLPVSGLTHWHNGQWLIAINAQEPIGRQRFSLGHEFKHVLDHTTRQWLCPPELGMSTETKSERLADYFAGCLLMPKRHVKKLFGERVSIENLAAAFGVTKRAMQVRLSQLGLTEPTPRCLRPTPNWDHFGKGYFRVGSRALEVAA